MHGRPVVLRDQDVARLKAAEYAVAHPGESVAKLPFTVGDKVMVVDGAFAERVAKIARLDDAEGIELLMDIFRRETTVWASATQIEAVN
jgi:transcription antitermination factor NusG